MRTKTWRMMKGTKNCDSTQPSDIFSLLNLTITFIRMHIGFVNVRACVCFMVENTGLRSQCTFFDSASWCCSFFLAFFAYPSLYYLTNIYLIV